MRSLWLANVRSGLRSVGDRIGRMLASDGMEWRGEKRSVSIGQALARARDTGESMLERARQNLQTVSIQRSAMRRSRTQRSPIQRFSNPTTSVTNSPRARPPVARRRRPANVRRYRDLCLFPAEITLQSPSLLHLRPGCIIPALIVPSISKPEFRNRNFETRISKPRSQNQRSQNRDLEAG